MKEFFKANEDKNQYLMELDLSDPEKYDKNRILSVYSSSWMSRKTDEDLGAVNGFLELAKLIKQDVSLKAHKRFFMNFGQRIANEGFVMLKAFSSKRDVNFRSGMISVIGSTVDPISDCFSHSCSNNVFWIPTSSGLQMLFVERPIKAGSELFLSHGVHFETHTRKQRQKFLQKSFGLKCRCEACEQDYPTMEQTEQAPVDLGSFENFRFFVEQSEMFDSLRNKNLKQIQMKLEETTNSIQKDVQGKITDESFRRRHKMIACLSALAQPENIFA